MQKCHNTDPLTIFQATQFIWQLTAHSVLATVSVTDFQANKQVRVPVLRTFKIQKDISQVHLYAIFNFELIYYNTSQYGTQCKNKLYIYKYINH